MAKQYQVCTRCIMDTTDPDIQFDENGVCNHCKRYEERVKRYLHLDATGQQKLERLVDQIKAQGQGKDYDCIVGVSGGVDSTYAAYQAKKLGLRPLAVHLDNGWDSELAVSNIETVLKRLDIDLYTYVLDWEEFKDLQLSFLKASVSDAEIPTDHAISAIIYRAAVQRGISYLISGSNLATEGILPGSWTYGVDDWRYIRSVQENLGQASLKDYPHYSLFDLLYYVLVKRIRAVRILNYMPYNKKETINVLETELGWKYYGAKHYESIYTRFFQGYILPRKFNIDKRKAHLSTLICSGQMTRAQALDEMKHEPYSEDQQEADKEYVIKKLGLTEEEFERIMSLPIKTCADYPTSAPLFRIMSRFAKVAQKLRLAPQNLARPQ